MKNWFTRLLAVMFVLSMVISPQTAVFAVDHPPVNVDEGSTPSEGEGEDAQPDEGDDADQPGDDGDGDDPVGDGDGTDDPSDAGTGDDADSPGEDGIESKDNPDDIDQTGDGSAGEGDADITDPGDQSGDDADEIDVDAGVEPASMAGPLARIDDNWTLFNPEYDVNTGNLRVSITLNAGFEAEQGDYIRIITNTLFDGDMTILSLATVSAPDLFNVQISEATGTLSLNFEDDYPAATALPVQLNFNTEMVWEACDPNTIDPYDQRARITLSDSFGTGGQQRSVEVAGPTCPGHGGPQVSAVGYSPLISGLEIRTVLPGNQLAGTSATITYPPSQIQPAPGTYQIWAFSFDTASDIVLGTAVVTDGLITLNFDFNNPDADISGSAWLEIPATIVTEACETGVGVIEIDPIHYVATPGGEFTDELPEILCDAAPMTKTGTWISETDMEWTIDSGDLHGNAIIDDSWGYGLMALDCSVDDPVSITYVDGYDEPAAPPHLYSCYEDGFSIYLEGDIIHRVEITFRTTVYPDELWTSYLNCAEAVAEGYFEVASTQQTSSLGLGGMACYELFPEEGGDTLSKTVDVAEVESGESVTYTVAVSTSSDNWSSITVTDALPTGFEIDESSIECEVAPAVHESDPCYTLIDNELTVVANAVVTEGWGPNISDPADITLTFSGVITGNPGDVIANEACSERIYQDQSSVPMVVTGDPTIPGGGVICETAIVTIIGDDDETPLPTITPSPTPDPTIPATPGATPTTPADPTATSAVTGLPETGSSGSGAASSVFLAVMAASLLMAAAVGIRLRPRG